MPALNGHSFGGWTRVLQIRPISNQRIWEPWATSPYFLRYQTHLVSQQKPKPERASKFWKALKTAPTLLVVDIQNQFKQSDLYSSRLQRCLCEYWIQMRRFWTNLPHFTWPSMPPRVYRTFSNPISALKAPSRCNLFSSRSFLLFHLKERCDFYCWLCRLVGGSGDIKLTKDGNTLLKEMVRFFPTEP